MATDEIDGCVATMMMVDENPISARTSQFCGPPPEKLLIPPDLTRRLNCVVRWFFAFGFLGKEFSRKGPGIKGPI